MNKTAAIDASKDNKTPQLKARNASRMAEISRPHFDSAYEKGLMGVSCRTLENRRIEIATSGKKVIDYTRCRYLSLDSHPKVFAAAKASMDEIRKSTSTPAIPMTVRSAVMEIA